MTGDEIPFDHFDPKYSDIPWNDVPK